MKDSILKRITRGINPFNVPREQQLQTEEYDLNVVRLCIQVYLQDETGQYTRALNPIVTNPIYDNRSPNTAELRICRVNRNTGSVKGQDEIFLLCDKVQKDDIEVRFFSADGWEAKGSFSQADVHRQVAIVFKTPAYYNPSITESVTVQMQLRRPSDQEVSEAIDYRYLPDDKDPYGCNEKKRKRQDLMKLATLQVNNFGLSVNRPSASASKNLRRDMLLRHQQLSSLQQPPQPSPVFPSTFQPPPALSNLPPSPWPSTGSSNIPIDSVTVNPTPIMSRPMQRNVRPLVNRRDVNPSLPQLSVQDLKCLEPVLQQNQETQPLYHLPRQPDILMTDNGAQNQAVGQNQGLQMQWSDFGSHNPMQGGYNGAVPGGGNDAASDGGGTAGLGFNFLEQLEGDNLLQNIVGGPHGGFAMKQEPQMTMHSPGQSSTYINLLPSRPASNGTQPLKHPNQYPNSSGAQTGTHYANLEEWFKSS